jgi:hypothetical protein
MAAVDNGDQQPAEDTVVMPQPIADQRPRRAELPSGADIARWPSQGGASQPTEQIPQVEKSRPWLWTTVASVVALAMFVVLGIGVWLILHAMGGDGEKTGPATPAPSEAASSASATASAVESSAEPQESATPTAPASAQDQVTVPNVVGKPVNTATGALTTLGLRVSIQYQSSGTATPGTVLETLPAAGSLVAVDSTVTLVVERAVSPTAAPPTVIPSPPTAPRPSGGFTAW